MAFILLTATSCRPDPQAQLVRDASGNCEVGIMVVAVDPNGAADYGWTETASTLSADREWVTLQLVDQRGGRHSAVCAVNSSQFSVDGHPITNNDYYVTFERRWINEAERRRREDAVLAPRTGEAVGAWLTADGATLGRVAYRAQSDAEQIDLGARLRTDISDGCRAVRVMRGTLGRRFIACLRNGSGTWSLLIEEHGNLPIGPMFTWPSGLITPRAQGPGAHAPP